MNDSESDGSVHDVVFFFQAEDGIRDLVRSRGLEDVYKRQFVVFERDQPFVDGGGGGHGFDALGEAFESDIADLSLIHI